MESHEKQLIYLVCVCVCVLGGGTTAERHKGKSNAAKLLGQKSQLGTASSMGTMGVK